MRMRGGAGLGDAIYMRPLAEHLVREGRHVTVMSDYPDVFSGSGAVVEPFARNNIDILAHYTTGKQNPLTNQWEDICNSAKIHVPLKFDWTVRNHTLVNSVNEYARGRKIVLVHGGRMPMNRTDGFGKELLPDRRAFKSVLDEFADSLLVRIGRGDSVYPLHTDVDLSNDTTVTDLFDLAITCDAIVGQCSFIIPLAEALNRPLMIVWAADGLDEHCHPYIKSITPRKILSKATSFYVMDSWSGERIHEEVNKFIGEFK